nr:tyrosine-type recombinase/integrase [Pseudonocardia autotrophica]
MRPAVGELLAAASRRAGLDRLVRPRQLRYAYGSDLVDAGNGIDVVADLLGHASISSSQAHVHPPVPAGRRSGRGAQPPRADGSSAPVSASATDARRRRIVAPVRRRARLACVRRRRGPRRAGRLAGHAGRPRGECGWDPVGQLLAPPAARVDAAGRLSPGSGERGAVRGGRLFVLPAPRSTDVVGIFRLTTRSSASSARCSLNNTTSGGSGHRSHWRRNLHL